MTNAIPVTLCLLIDTILNFRYESTYHHSQNLESREEKTNTHNATHNTTHGISVKTMKDSHV